jgi:hypothetical protein
MSTKKTLRMLSLAIALLWLPLLPSTARAQDQELPADLQRLVDEAQARKAIAEARKAELEAKFPKPDTDAVRGKTDIQGDFIETLILGRQAMEAAAVKIASDIGSSVKGQTLAIYKKEYVDLLVSYQTMLKRLEILKKRFEDFKPGDCESKTVSDTVPTNKSLGFLPPGVIANIAVNWLGLFRTDVSLTGREFDIGEKEIVAKVFNSLRTQSNAAANFYYLDQMLPNVDWQNIQWSATSSSELVKLIYGIVTVRDGVFKKLPCGKGNCKCESLKKQFGVLNDDFNGFLDAMGLKGLKLVIAAADQGAGGKESGDSNNASPSSNGNVENPFDDQQPNAKPTSKTNAKSGASETSGTIAQREAAAAEGKEPEAGTTVNVNCGKAGEDKGGDKGGGGGGDLLSLYLQAEQLYTLMGPQDGAHVGYWLDIQVIKAGGNIRVKSSPLIDIFRGGNSVKFSGGVIVVYNLYDRTGRSLLSDTVPVYVSYKSSGKIK